MTLGMMIYAICGVLTAAGCWWSLRLFRRRRRGAALRTLALALLPMGLAMTGVIRFVVNMTVNPIAWAGFGLIGLSVLLTLVSRWTRDPAPGAVPGDAATAPGASSPAATPARREARPELPETAGGSAGRGAGRSGSSRNEGAEDFSDIEAILKKHGI
ncbi:hypothetical protein [Streptomyces sp. ST2-7A]|uniref:hypothetical protein n=1 Tax=Streptomyces sp. ST2-7A TaxID=2907214 RepID=UPI001F364F26|nr:hypothetical protein [Streptomyces sp. ST2-7A]MCE7079739.1 hypothetical protein [Streptomyces sp. ST2-7A]